MTNQMSIQKVIGHGEMLEEFIDGVYALMGFSFAVGILLGVIIGLWMYKKLITEGF